jgi:hypothetical protein
MSVTLEIREPNASCATLHCLLNSGRYLDYLLSARPAGPPSLSLLMHILSKMLMRDIECRNMLMNLLPILSWPIGNDLMLLRTDLRPLLYQNECGRLCGGEMSRSGLDDDGKVYDFGTAQKYVEWDSIFIGRFAAISVVQFALEVGPPLPFDFFVDLNQPRISAVQVGRPSEKMEFGFCRSLSRFFPMKMADEVLPVGCAKAWQCFSEKREVVSLYLRAFCDEFNGNLSPVLGGGSSMDEQSFAALIESSRTNSSNLFAWL